MWSPDRCRNWIGISKIRAGETGLDMLSHGADTTWDHLQAVSSPSCVHVTATLLSHLANRDIGSDTVHHRRAEPPRRSLSWAAMTLEGPSGEGAVTRWRKPKFREAFQTTPRVTTYPSDLILSPRLPCITLRLIRWYFPHLPHRQGSWR